MTMQEVYYYIIVGWRNINSVLYFNSIMCLFFYSAADEDTGDQQEDTL